jgi:alpha-1,6-mannosyltransferase
MRIVQIANFVSPTSGGIRTTLATLRSGYRDAGHDPVLVVPGASDAVEASVDGLIVRVAAPKVPRSGGYRMIVDLRTVHRVLDELRPDRIEVNDRFTLRGIGDWAARHDVPSIAVVHERLDHLSAMHLPWLLRPGQLVRRDNRAVAARFDRVVSPSHWAAQEFVKAGATNVDVVSWGVDHQRFHPSRRSRVLRRRLLGRESVLLVMVCRLSPEKRPESAVDALAALRARGVDARLVVAGTGQQDRPLRKAAKELPVTFLGHLHGRDHVAELLAAADVAICPGPIETFGLAALEAMASGTPVVSSRSGAIAELLAEPYGIASYNHGRAMASAVTRLLDGGDVARHAARARAEQYPWSTSIDAMLHLHGLGPRPVGPAHATPASA